jgi:hypothetical protein
MFIDDIGSPTHLLTHTLGKWVGLPEERALMRAKAFGHHGRLRLDRNVIAGDNERPRIHRADLLTLEGLALLRPRDDQPAPVFGAVHRKYAWQSHHAVNLNAVNLSRTDPS